MRKSLTRIMTAATIALTTIATPATSHADPDVEPAVKETYTALLTEGDAESGLEILQDLQESDDPWGEYASLNVDESSDGIAALQKYPNEYIDSQDEHKEVGLSDGTYFYMEGEEPASDYERNRADFLEKAACVGATAVATGAHSCRCESEVPVCGRLAVTMNS
ncbi:hypothetical protein V5S96_05915 [Corynebacterium mastitidis]|uniref:Uncharacterized protein n=1 Tax=Corynebacterium mastitidis TaxID=161890 RepID=A0ABU8NY53_9CORY